MSIYLPVPLGSRFTTTLQVFANDDGLPFTHLLPEEQLQRVADEQGVHFASDPDDIFTPAITLWAFVGQCLSSCKSCVAAVARVMVLRIALGLPPCAAYTGGYCKARNKLPVAFLQGLTYLTAETTEDQAPDNWRWHGRRTLLVDGTEVTAADTPANQRVYPQPSTQKPGMGFPCLRLVVLLTFATAGVVGAACGPHRGKETGETALFRELLDRLRPNDVVVADRYYCSFCMLALLQQRRVDAAFRLHQKRKYDFRRGQRLGRDDHKVVWPKPERPSWMDEATYAALPDSLTIREVRFAVTTPGFRSREIVVATTLVDADRYSRQDIADLYHRRWHVELDIRSIKQTLAMEHLRCKTPEMVRRELWAHLLAYNAIRLAMAQAAATKGLCPRQLSFAGALQTLEAFRWLLLFGGEAMRGAVTLVVCWALASHEVGDRPNRVEPRRVKRRPKPHKLLMVPRAEARAALLQGSEE